MDMFIVYALSVTSISYEREKKTSEKKKEREKITKKIMQGKNHCKWRSWLLRT